MRPKFCREPLLLTVERANTTHDQAIRVERRLCDLCMAGRGVVGKPLPLVLRNRAHRVAGSVLLSCVFENRQQRASSGVAGARL